MAHLTIPSFNCLDVKGVNGMVPKDFKRHLKVVEYSLRCEGGKIQCVGLNCEIKFTQ